MDNFLKPYFDALFRLENKCPIHIPKGSVISYDTVSLEAGKGRGTIKKSRRVYDELRAKIDDAHTRQVDAGQVKVSDDEKVALLTKDVNALKLLLANAYGRELSLVKEISNFKKDINALTGANILPIRRKNVPKR